MKKSFIFTTLFFVLILFIIMMNFRYLNPYNTELFHPVFGALFPLTFLLFFSGFLKNIKYKSVLLSIVIFIIIDTILLSQINPICSQIICYDRSTSALILSLLFSIIYFIVLFLKNKKQPTLVK